MPPDVGTRRSCCISSSAIFHPLVRSLQVDGMLRSQYRVVLSTDYRVIDLMTRLSPALASWLRGVAARRMPF